jgi:hypothetical protein
VEVWDYDMGPKSDDLIGEALFELADMQVVGRRW